MGYLQICLLFKDSGSPTKIASKMFLFNLPLQGEWLVLFASSTMIAIKYTIFAAISILASLLFQYLSLVIYSGYGDLYLAMLLGTFSGLLLKYTIDKNYIFYYSNESSLQQSVLYAVTGGAITGMFWVIEIGFDFIFATKYSKYIAAVLGLSIGYTVKYFLDKKFSFRNKK